MKLVILGCGRVGSTLASLMSRDGHEVTVIDYNADSFRRLPTDYAGVKVLGTGIDEDVLRNAKVGESDAFVALTEGDNRNIMAAQVVKLRFGVPKVIARIYDPIRAEAYHELGIETICTTAVGAGALRDYILDRPLGSVQEYLGLCQCLLEPPQARDQS